MFILYSKNKVGQWSLSSTSHDAMSFEKLRWNPLSRHVFDWYSLAFVLPGIRVMHLHKIYVDTATSIYMSKNTLKRGNIKRDPYIDLDIYFCKLWTLIASGDKY